ncbi:MAG: hypothetical protein GEV03_16270, partial [Streptosporangiales bacterium]|nr:hypothetical protein [Streptosporangiales bacterium]
ERWSPPLSQVLGITERLPSGVKLAPGIDLALLPSGDEVEFISHQGRLVEAVLWRGRLASAPRRATVLPGDDSLAGEPDRGITAVGEPGRPPLPLPDGCLDALVGTHLAAAGLAALLRGVGAVEVAAVDVVAAAVGVNASLYLPYDIPWYRAGRRASRSGGCYPYGLFPVRDGNVCLIGRTRRDWAAIVAAAGRPDWSERPRYRDVVAMGRDYPDEVDTLLAPWLRGRDVDGVMADAATYGFPAGPVRRPEEVLAVDALSGWWRTADAGHAPGARAPGVPFWGQELPSAPAPRPLRDLFVLDLSWVWSGPAVAGGLADLGATVVKVESGRRVDNTRLRGRPPALSVADEAPFLEVNPYFHAINRGKRSLTLDLTTPAARAILARLAARADVIVENLSPGVVERWGLDDETVARTNPGCVFVSLRGYRDHPSLAGLRAYAPVLSSAAGIEHLVRYPGEEALGLLTFGYSDAYAAGYGLALALAGLWARARRGVGARVALSQFEASVFANGRNLAAAQNGALPDGLDPLPDDGRIVGAEDLPTAPWTSSDLFAAVDHPWLGTLRLPRLPWRLDGALPAVHRPAPALGADTEAVLCERLGLAPGEVAELRDSGALE